MLAAHAVLLARKARHPVKIVYGREEDIAFTTKRHPAVIRHRLGARNDGFLVAADVDVVLDGGAYVTLSPVVLSRALIHAAGPYAIPNVRMRGRVVATNHPPHGAFRGFGAPQTAFAYERQMDKLAQRLGVDPLALRGKNRLRLGSTTATGQVLNDSVGSGEVLAALERARQRPAPRERVAVPGQRVRRGSGISFCWHGAGFTGSGEEKLQSRAAVAVAADGGLEVRTASTDIGQGTDTVFTQIVAEALGVQPENLRLTVPATDRVPDSGPTVASRTCMVVGGLLQQAATALRSRLLAFAAERGLATGDLVGLAEAHARERGELVETVTYAPPPGLRWDDRSFTGDAYPVFGWAACQVDVAVDLDTFEVTVERCLHAVDVGRAIHPVLAAGQIEGGTLQALGWALWEHVAYRDGRVLNPTMTDCIIPTAIEAPELETILVEVPFARGPGGAKGVGEIPMDGPAAAVANAVSAALGLPIDELPVRPESLLARWTAARGT
jgi:CO/xanthine dehydrogenase Mo-binding subunit